MSEMIEWLEAHGHVIVLAGPERIETETRVYERAYEGMLGDGYWKRVKQ